MSKEKTFVDERILDIEELYSIVKSVKRHNVRRAIAKGVLDYKDNFEKLNIKDARIKSFSAYAAEALTLIAGIAIEKKEAEAAFQETFSRMKEIAKETEE